MTEREITEFTLQLIGQFFGFYLLYFLLIIAAGVMLALAVYNDARYRGNRNAVLWAVLSGFFGIAGLIYLIVQLASKRYVVCATCYRPIPSAEPLCPVCGAVSPEVYRFSPPELREKQRKRRFLFLFLYIGFMVLAVLLVVGLIWYMFDQVLPQIYAYSYSY